MSRLTRYLRERFTALEWNLAQRFGRRELHRALDGLSQRRTLGPRGSEEVDSLERGSPQGRNLAGLEVTWTGSGWGLNVSAGRMLIALTPATDEARPGSWDAGAGREPDDYPIVMGVWTVIQSAESVAPASPPGGALSGYEHWLVYATVSEATVETDTDCRQFNQGTGVFDTSTKVKVKQHQLTLTVLRSASNSAPPYSSVPNDGVVIAQLYVPSGATNLSSAIIYDCRVLPELAPGPNKVGGCWRFSTEGQISSPYGQTVFLGRVWARLGGELLGARAYGSAIQVGDLVEPGASWPAATSSTPKIAWLYLCRVRGYVPRPVRVGSSALGNNGSPTQAANILLDGMLVLSPTPPRIGASVSAELAAQSGLRWDLRPSAALTLPGFQRGDIPYRYSGLAVSQDDAICVGFYRYTDVDGVPVLQGSLHVDENGWMSGSSIASESGQGTNPDGLFTLPTFTKDNSAAPRTLTSGSYGPAQITLSGVAYPLPIDAVRLVVPVALSGDGFLVRGKGTDAGRWWQPNGSSQAYPEIERRQAAPGQPNFPQIQFAVPTSTWVTEAVYVLAVRFPYGEALVT